MTISRNHLPHCLPQSSYEDESKSDDEFSPSRFNRNISKTAQSRLRKSGNTGSSLLSAGRGDVNQGRDAIMVTSLNNLSPQILEGVIQKFLNKLRDKVYKKTKIRLEFDPTLVQYLSDHGYHPLLGARPVNSTLQNF